MNFWNLNRVIKFRNWKRATQYRASILAQGFGLLARPKIQMARTAWAHTRSARRDAVTATATPTVRGVRQLAGGWTSGCSSLRSPSWHGQPVGQGEEVAELTERWYGVEAAEVLQLGDVRR
jgi:hypothetical protein